MTRVLLLSAVLGLVLIAGGSQQASGVVTVVKFSPSTKYASPGGGSFTVDVAVQDVVTRNPCPWNPPGPCGLGAYSFKLSFDPTVIEWVSTVNGSFFIGYRPIYQCLNAPGHDPENGIVAYECTTLGGTAHGPTGSGVLSTITFAPLVEGTTPLTFQATRLSEIDGTSVPHSSQNGSVIIAPHADLQVTKTAEGTVTAPGSIVYTVQVTNHGPNEAQNVSVMDTLSTDVSYVSASPGCSWDSGQHKVTCSLGNVASGQFRNVIVTASVATSKAGKSITNVADASSSTLDPNTANNHAQVSTVVNPANVNVVKSAPGQVNKGATGQYQIVATSTGPSGASGVSVVDVLPSGVTYVGSSATPPGSTCYYYLAPDPTVQCALGDLPVSSSATVTITVTFPNLDRYVCNRGKVQWTQTPPPPVKESEQACTTVGVPDADGDGCTNEAELGQDLMRGGGRNPSNPYDFYDVPVPANADPTANGPRNKVIDIGDVLAVLFYAFAEDNGGPNANGVDYDSIKHSCTINGVPNLEEGLCYDRSPASPVSGSSNGVVDIGDVLSALEQFGADCNW
jgi:uncharacterized repeat protein (TIGR01451 family)